MKSSSAALDEFQEFEELFSLRLNDRQKLLVEAYWTLLERWNRTVRLTAIGSFREALQFHFFESFWAAKRFLRGDEWVADVGSGAGFPGLAAKIYLPGLQTVLLECNRKKAVFLQEASRQLDLKVEVFAGDAEDYPNWSSIDVALIRALKPPRTVLDILRRQRIPLLDFHGSRLEAPGMTPARTEPVPASRNRYVSLLTPDMDRLEA